MSRKVGCSRRMGFQEDGVFQEDGSRGMGPKYRSSRSGVVSKSRVFQGDCYRRKKGGVPFSRKPAPLLSAYPLVVFFATTAGNIR